MFYVSAHPVNSQLSVSAFNNKKGGICRALTVNCEPSLRVVLEQLEGHCLGDVVRETRLLDLKFVLML